MSLASADSRNSSIGGPVGSSSPPICMIVEDQALIGLALEGYLEDLGFDMGEPLSSAAAALEWLATHTPTVAVLDFTLRTVPAQP